MKQHLYTVLMLLSAACIIAVTACNQQKSRDVAAQFKGHAFPKAVGWVNDFAYLYTKEETDTLNNIIQGHKNATTNQIAVITINDSIITPENLGDYCTTLFNAWGIGEKGKNNGVLLCIVPKAHLLQITTGEGLEKKLTNTECKQVLDSVIAPEFKYSDYYAGTKNGILAIINEIK